MYRITYVHKNESTENPLYIPGDSDYCLITATLDLECGKSGELNIALPDINPAKEDILCLTDEVIVYRDQEEIWRGRPVTLQMDFDRTGTLTCEGILSYLYDTAFPPFEFEGSPKEFLQMILDNHNSQVDSLKQFQLGDVTVEDNNDYINRSSIYYDKSLNVLVEKLIEDTLGGYFRVRIENGVRYLDYLESYNTQATQMVQFGENILDIAEEIEYSDLATVILPLGAKLKDDEGMDTDEYLTIASVNGGSYYYADETAVNTYGWIVVIAEWSDVTVPDNLLTKAKDYLSQVTSAISSFTVNAIDLSLISDEEPIRLGDYVWIRSTPHGINQYIELTEQHIDILYPENDVLSFGVDTATLTGSQKSTDRAVQSALGSLTMRVTNLSADVIDAVYANIETIIAGTINADYIYSICAEIGYLTADEIDATYVRTDELEADIANIGFLTADSAIITSLTAFAETAYVLLGGVGSFGELDAIHLTVENTVIDQAVIEQAVAGTILADLIYADYINTDIINIMSDDGGITIIGNQMQFTNGQIQFYDEDGNLRLQLGQDASGNFTFELYAADGSGVMIDENGIYASAVTDGLIVDRMVADDANISGYKLNIEEICSIINTSEGVYTIEAASVTIDGQQLSAWYTQVNQELEGLYGLSEEGLINTVPYFCLWDSDTDAPPADGDLTAAICGQATCGLTICGVTDGVLWKDTDMPVTDGLYKWVKWKGYYLDGHEEWGDPYCLTDGYLREQTQVLQTGLTVVQGQIEAKVWESDIESYVDPLYGEITTLTDNYAYIEVRVDSIDEQVASVTTTEYEHYLETSSQIGDIQVTISEISLQVSNVEQNIEQVGYTLDELEEKIDNMEGVESWTPYWCLWDSGTEAPPDNDDLTAAICGTAVCGLTICGVTDGKLWKEDRPSDQDGLYLWVKFFLTYTNDATGWYGPYCMTDVYTRSQISSAWATIDILDNKITEEVGNVQQIITEDYEYLSSQIASIEVETSDITLKVEDLEVWQANLSVGGTQILRGTSDMSANLGGSSNWNAGTWTRVNTSSNGGYANAIDVTDAPNGAITSGVEMYTPSSASSYTSIRQDNVPVTDGENYVMSVYVKGTGRFRFQYGNGTYQYADIDVDAPNWKRISLAFTYDASASGDTDGTNRFYFGTRQAGITLQICGMKLEVGTVATDWDECPVDISSAIAEIELGIIQTQEDIISYINASADVIVLTGDRIVIQSDYFSLTADGYITASGGNIAGWTIFGNGLYSASASSGDIVVLSPEFISLGSTSVSLDIDGNVEQDGASFIVTKNGEMTATRGYIGGFRISTYALTGGDADAGQAVMMQIPVGEDESATRWWAFAAAGYSHTNHSDARFRVGSLGEMYCTRIVVENQYDTESGRFVRVSNDAGAMSLYVNSDGSRGLYNTTFGEWMCRYYPTNDVNRFGNTTRDTYIYGKTISGLNAIATAAEYDVEDISMLAATQFRDPAHETITHISSHTYELNGKKHLGLTVNELETAMRDAGMDPDEYDITDEFIDEDGTTRGAIRYEELIPMLISEIQSLNSRIDALEEE